MSMYRQLWLAVIVSTLLALIGSLLGSTLGARGYLQEQLQMKNMDNAVALALSLSQTNSDIAEMELVVSALFDSGHYEAIVVVDPFGKTVVERHAPAGEYDAPLWFVKLLPIKPAPGLARISSSWKQMGTVTLSSHSRFAYRALWRSVMELISVLAAAGLVSGYLATLILRRLRAPLNTVINQAQAITERRFVTITEPRVPELRQLASAMNFTVARLKAMFEEEAKRLEAVRNDANSDPLTGLANRNYFMARLKGATEGEDAGGGALMLIRVADLAGINRRLGRGATDDLLTRFARAISACTEPQPDGLASRLNGADFSLLLTDPARARPLADQLLQTLIQEGAPFVESGATAFIGIGSFARGADVAGLLSRVDGALAGAEAVGIDAVREVIVSTDEESPKSADEWSKLILRALDQRWVRLVSFPVADCSGQLIHRECPLRLLSDEQGEWMPAGLFLPIAERLKLTPRLDLAAITLGLEQLSENPTLTGLAINLSASSLQDPEFRRELRTLLQHQHLAAHRLWLEVAEAGAFKHFDTFRSFCRDLDGSGCRIGLEHFGRQFSQIGLLHDMGLDYLKVDASFIRDIESNAGNQAFLKGLSSIAHNIGMTVYAEGVASEQELAALSDLGFDGATGPAVKD